ncbi:hypothetical protein [Poseidonibacter sp.]|uniref:hypothetical protein n=1 Tax=Poseidonibacter sp. TaxID=2321188 RepID=UPI003C785C30
MLKKYKSNILISILLMFFVSGCNLKQLNIIEKKEFKREKISVELLNTIDNIKELISKHDYKSLNENYINQRFGFFDKFKVDNKVNVIKLNKIQFDKNDKDYFSIANQIHRTRKKTSLLKIINGNPLFDCSPNNDAFYGWNKEGLFLSDKAEAFTYNKSEKILENYSDEDFDFEQIVSKTSYKVSFTDEEIIFYLSKIDDKWYITLFDRTITDCSLGKRKKVKRVK